MILKAGKFYSGRESSELGYRLGNVKGMIMREEEDGMFQTMTRSFFYDDVLVAIYNIEYSNSNSSNDYSLTILSNVEISQIMFDYVLRMGDTDYRPVKPIMTIDDIKALPPLIEIFGGNLMPRDKVELYCKRDLSGSDVHVLTFLDKISEK